MRRVVGLGAALVLLGVLAAAATWLAYDPDQQWRESWKGYPDEPSQFSGGEQATQDFFRQSIIAAAVVGTAFWGFAVYLVMDRWKSLNAYLVRAPEF